MIKRCWAGGDDPLMLTYHDQEWGVPLRGDRAARAGLYLRHLGKIVDLGLEIDRESVLIADQPDVVN